MKYFVTGGTGFLGKNLVKRLADGTDEVRVLARKTSDTSGLDLPGVAIVHGDMTDPESLKRGMEGCGRVFHVAAMVKAWARDRTLFDRINVEGVDTICRIATESGVERVVYTASFMALGQTDAGVATETTVRDPEHVHNDYERTKVLAETVVARHVADGVPVVSVYPGVIYGPGEVTDGNIVVKLLLEQMSGKLPGIPGKGDKTWTYGYVDDVVAGHLLAMEKGVAGERYILGGELATANRFFEIFEEVSGIAKPKRHLSFSLLKAIAMLCETGAVLFGKEPTLTRGSVEVYKHNWAYDCTKAEQELGYTHISLKEGLARTYEWLRSRPEK